MKIKKHEISTPGSGYIWKKQITVPKEFTFQTDINHLHNQNNRLVNNKEIPPRTSSNNFNPKTHVSYKKMPKLFENKTVKIKIEKLEMPTTEHPQWLQEQSKMGVHIKEKMYFDDALKYLHAELHSLDI